MCVGVMATVFALNHFGAKFQVKLTDCVTGDDIDTSNVAEQFIVFFKPDGTSFEKTATLVEEPASSGIFFITYTNTTPETESILDLIANWEYAGKVKLTNDDEFQTSERFVFWVSWYSNCRS